MEPMDAMGSPPGPAAPIALTAAVSASAKPDLHASLSGSRSRPFW